jgi:hypothetical protein
MCHVYRQDPKLHLETDTTGDLQYCQAPSCHRRRHAYQCQHPIVPKHTSGWIRPIRLLPPTSTKLLAVAISASEAARIPKFQLRHRPRRTPRPPPPCLHVERQTQLHIKLLTAAQFVRISDQATAKVRIVRSGLYAWLLLSVKVVPKIIPPRVNVWEEATHRMR